MLKKILLLCALIVLSGCSTYSYSLDGEVETTKNANVRAISSVSFKVSQVCTENGPFKKYPPSLIPNQKSIEDIVSLIPSITLATSENYDYQIVIKHSGEYENNDGFLQGLTYFFAFPGLCILPCSSRDHYYAQYSAYDSTGVEIISKKYPASVTKVLSLIILPALPFGHTQGRVSKAFLYDTLSDFVVQVAKTGKV